jgi:hypothetical protein
MVSLMDDVSLEEIGEDLDTYQVDTLRDFLEEGQIQTAWTHLSSAPTRLLLLFYEREIEIVDLMIEREPDIIFHVGERFFSYHQILRDRKNYLLVAIQDVKDEQQTNQ